MLPEHYQATTKQKPGLPYDGKNQLIAKKNFTFFKIYHPHQRDDILAYRTVLLNNYISK